MTSQEPALAAPVVIIVDDDSGVRASLKFAFEIEGFIVRAYGDRDELFADTALAACACFVIDQNLPGARGLDVAVALRQQRIAAPMILITSAPSRILQERAAKAGIQIVEKPLLGNALIDCVRAVTAHSAGNDGVG
jgi:FixJ family two-component response regulator